MRKCFLLLMMVLLVHAVHAQELSVKSFAVASNDLTAMSRERIDNNGLRCAVVKVRVALSDVRFDGAIMGDVVCNVSEYWVYMPKHSVALHIFHQDYTPLDVVFEDYGISQLESGTTYILTLVKPGNASEPSEKGGNSSLSSGNTINIPIKNGVSIEMVKINAGSFMMGAIPELENSFEDEKPAHYVTLTNDYYIGKYEVTQTQWLAVMGCNPSKFKGDYDPVEMVSWKDCQKFINKLNSITGRRFRMPTEAEWEYAARGGHKMPGPLYRDYQYSGSGDISDVAWYDGNSDNMTHSVGTRQANELGVYDMSGNVWEWCQDRYGRYSSKAVTNPTKANGAYRVCRGGSWANKASFCRLSCRDNYSSDAYGSNIGLRLALSE